MCYFSVALCVLFLFALSEDLRPKIDAEVAERIVRFYTAGNQASDERAKRRKVLRSADNSEETQDEVEIEQEEEIEIEQEEEIDEEEEEEGELLLPQIELDSPKSIKEVAKSLKDVARLSKTKNRSAALAKNAMASSSSALRGKSSALVSPTSNLSGRASALIAGSLSSSARATSSKAPSLKASSLSGCKKAVEIDLVSSASDKTDHGEVEKGSRRKDKQKRVEEKTVKTPETGKQRKQISDVGKRRLEDIIKGVAGRRDLSSREIEIDSSPKDLRNAKRKRQENKDEPTQIEEDSDAGNKAMHRKAKKAKKQQQSKVAPSAESSAVQRSFERPTSLAVSPSRSPNSSMIEVQKKKKNKKIEKKKISKRLAESTATKKISSKVRR